MDDKKKQSPHSGHRSRLRKRFKKTSLDGFADHEIVELLLSFGTPRKDTKQPARDALAKFDNLRGVLEASQEELQTITGIGPKNVLALTVVREVATRYLGDKITGKRKTVSSSQAVFDYLNLSLRHLKKEVFQVLFLNSRNQIVAAEVMFEGTVNSSAVSPREVIERALVHKAVSLIFVHNHPSGNKEPSQSDKDLTRDLVFAANAVNMKVLDHIIIGNSDYFSFAGNGLIEQDESDFLNKKVNHKPRKTPPDRLAGDGLPWSKP